jgi:FAD/FMN-containing dehydrogenase
VLAEFGDSADAAQLNERVAQALGEREAVLAQSAEQARSLWRLRESIPEAQFANVKHDVSVPVSKTPELIERAGRALAARFPQARVYAFGHVGDGNIHFNVGPESLLAERAAVNRVVYDTVAALGGSISAEHGLGQLKREEVLAHKPALEIELMRALKRALDPKGVMNPGKLL